MKFAFWSISSRRRRRPCPSVGESPELLLKIDEEKNLIVQRFETRISELKPVRFMPNISNNDFFCSDKSCLGPACLVGLRDKLAHVFFYAVEDGVVTLSDGPPR